MDQQITSTTLREPSNADSRTIALPSRSTLRTWYIAILISIGCAQAYTSRYSMGIDALGYTDIAVGYLTRNWQVAINWYWSPLYSWLLVIFFAVLKPGQLGQFPTLHLVNLGCFLFTLFAFHRFWSKLSSVQSTGGGSLSSESPRLWDMVGYSLFCFFFCPLVAAPTPDLLSAGFVFLLCDQLLQVSKTRAISLFGALNLGVLIAFAYFAKAILLYFGLTAVTLLALDWSIRKRYLLAVTTVVLALCAIPWVLCIHQRYGEYTLGTSGRMNYIWFANGCPTGPLMEPGSNPYVYSPFLLGPKLYESPGVFEIASRPGVTFLPWFDPAEFDHLRRPEFILNKQLHAIRLNARYLRDWFLFDYSAMTIVVLSLLIASGMAGLKEIFWYRHLVLPTIAVFALYLLVFIRTYRYIAAFTVLLFAVGISCSRFKRDVQSVIRSVVIVGLFVSASIHVPEVIGSAFKADPMWKNLVEAAKDFRSLDFPSGVKAGGLGSEEYIYWSRLAQVPLKTAMWNYEADEFWGVPSSERNRILCAIKSSGVGVVIGKPPLKSDKTQWERLGTTPYWVRRLDNPVDLNCAPQ